MSKMTEDEFLEVAREAWRGGEIEVRNPNGETWLPDTPFCPTCEYRIKPRKPSIDWSHISNEWKWLATYRSGPSYLFSHKPNISEGLWSTIGEYNSEVEGYETLTPILALHYSSFVPGTCDWKDSLVSREDDK